MTPLEELQHEELTIAKQFAAVCDKNGLKYYMLGGTMLGAIRHKGFIPWDDDMDFAMFRDDYEKFIELASKELPENLRLDDGRNIPEVHFYILRLYDTHTKITETRIGRDTNVSIDIFPIDGTPNGSLARKIYYFRVLAHRAIMSMCYKESLDRKRKRGKAEKCLMFAMEHLPIRKITTPTKQKMKIDKIMRKQKTDKSKFVGNLLGACRTKEVMPAEVYGGGAMYPFEDTQFRGPILYDTYLTQQYGEYMKCPSVEDQQRKTHFEVGEEK